MPALGRRTFLLVLFAALLASTGAFGARQTPVPDWVKAAAHASPPPFRPHDSAVVLFDQTDITVDASGRATVRRREAIKLLTVAGERYANYQLFYDTAAKVHYVHSWTIGADEHEYQLDDRDITDATAVPDFAVFDSERVRRASALAGEPGAIVAFESECVQEPFTTSWIYELDDMIPSTGRSFALTLPPGFTHSTSWAHMAPVAPVQTGPATWQWTIAPRVSLDEEDAAPAWGEIAARMVLSYSGPGVQAVDGSWSSVGTWFDNLSQDRLASTSAIQAKVDALTAGTSSYMGKLLAITGFLQDDIRYVAVEMGIGGWQPHRAADVLHNGYGDCKDKATLLIAMLRDAGIAAHPLLVDFDHRIDPNLPTHYADHMITAIEIPGDVEDARLHAVVSWSGRRLLIFDPTNSSSPAGSLEPELQHTWGLLLQGAQSTPLLLPALPPAANVLERTGEFAVEKDGSLSGDVSEERQGNTADIWRRLLLRGDVDALQKREEIAVRSSLADFTLSRLTAGNARERSTPLALHYHLAVAHYAKHAGSMLLVRPSVVGAYRVRDTENGRPRLYPIVLGQQEELRENDSVAVTAGYIPDELPDPIRLQCSFATFENAVTFDGKQLHYRRILTIHALQIPASGVAEYQEFFSKVANAEQGEVILKPSS